jgi:hypothetical protein
MLLCPSLIYLSQNYCHLTYLVAPEKPTNPNQEAVYKRIKNR